MEFFFGSKVFGICRSSFKEIGKDRAGSGFLSVRRPLISGLGCGLDRRFFLWLEHSIPAQIKETRLGSNGAILTHQGL